MGACWGARKGLTERRFGRGKAFDGALVEARERFDGAPVEARERFDGAPVGARERILWQT